MEEKDFDNLFGQPLDQPENTKTASAENETAASPDPDATLSIDEAPAEAAPEATLPADEAPVEAAPETTLPADDIPVEAAPETETVYTAGSTDAGAYTDAGTYTAADSTNAGTHTTDSGSTYSGSTYSTDSGSTYSGSTYSTDSGSTYTTGSGSTYNSENSYSSQGTYYSQSYNGSGSGHQYGAKHTPGYITKRAFVLILIVAMLFTMLASVGITTAVNSILSARDTQPGHATNYTLTTSDESLSYKSIIQKTQDSVVSITTESVTNDMWMQNYVTQGAGSGVIIDAKGYIITCEHVISGARKITVTLRNGKEYDAEIIGADADNDIAVIKIDADNLQEATYGDSSKLEVGDQVIAIGNPLGTLSGTATTGIISALNRNLTIDNKTLNLFQTDASINPGNSGGGMFDESGNLIGIVEAKSTGSDIDGLGFATPINKAAKIAKELIENGGSSKKSNKNGSGDDSKSATTKAVIGIMVAPVEEELAQQYGYSHGGLLVKSVNSEEASKAGIETGDIIFKAEGKSVSTNEDLSKILAKKKVGDTIKLSIARETGMNMEITTKLVSSASTF